jgi:DHA1 family bicyclomycin/chloramphenicol resistance-like MFS transporter
MLRPDTFALTGFLALLTMIGPLAIDLYLPALPQIGLELGATTAHVQLTISFYLVGFAFAQIVYGPVSDARGRRPVLLIALVVFCVASLLCVFAPSIELLIAARVVQAVGAAGAIVLARAIVRDIYSGARAGRELSIMGMIMGLAPAAAPTIGGLIHAAFGWRACFLTVFVAGLGALMMVWWLLPETLRDGPRAKVAPADLAGGYATVMRHRAFWAYLLLMSLASSGLFAYISGASFVLQQMFGLSPIQFGLTFALTSLGLIGGNSLAAHLVMRVGIGATMGIGTGALSMGGLAMVTATHFLPQAALGIVLPMVLFQIGIGMTMPQAFAGALQPFPHHAGTASSLAGFVQQCTAALSGAVVGHLIGASAWPMVSVLAASGCLAFVVWWWSCGVRGMS